MNRIRTVQNIYDKETDDTIVITTVTYNGIVESVNVEVL